MLNHSLSNSSLWNTNISFQISISSLLRGGAFLHLRMCWVPSLHTQLSSNSLQRGQRLEALFFSTHILPALGWVLTGLLQVEPTSGGSRLPGAEGKVLSSSSSASPFPGDPDLLLP